MIRYMSNFNIRGSMAYQIIKENKVIHKFELMEYLKFSVSTFEKFKPWFLFKYGVPNESGYVKYNRTSQEFVLSQMEAPIDQNF